MAQIRYPSGCVKAILYRLRSKGPYHFGGRGLDWNENAFGSDSFFSAVCVTLRDLIGPVRLNSFLRESEITSDPPMRFSVLLPYSGDVLFLPAPYLANQLVSPALFAALATGAARPESVPLQDEELIVATEDIEKLSEPIAAVANIQLKRQRRDSKTVDTGMLDDRLWVNEDVYHVAIDRGTAAGEQFRSNRTIFAEGCGLAALALVSDEWRPDVEAALRALADSGIGGERTSGHGQFSLEINSFELPDVRDPAAYLTLSHYLPTASELAGGVLESPANYQLVDRRGLFTTAGGRGLHRRPVRMVSAGSVLSPVKQGERSGPPKGQLVDVGPESYRDHRVIRAGWSLPVGIAARTS
jgi:CRISPR-associated protein Csm4